MRTTAPSARLRRCHVRLRGPKNHWSQCWHQQLQIVIGHTRHANLYRCFDHQNWPNKELVVLDSGSKASPFFTSLSDPRVRYQHLALRSNVLQLLEDLKEFVRMGSQGNPIAEGEPAWHDAWAALAQALEDAEANREWFELEDERGLRFRAIRVDGPACCHAGRKAEPALQPGQGPHPGAL